MPIKHPRSRLQRGISLIESLVAIVVMALGILGILGVQMRTLADTQTTVYRAQAIRLIEDLSERMKTNPNALGNLNNYVSGFSDEPKPDDDECSSGCSHSDQATYDLKLWKQAVKTQLPLGKASVFLAAGETADTNRRQLGVMLAWRENERNLSDEEKAAYKNSIDATKVLNDDGELVAGVDDGNACPSDHTCHLQYLPVAARCAPYRVNTAVNGEVKYFCPGPP